MLIPLVVSTQRFQRASGRTYRVARERISVLYADMQESLAGVEVSQAHGQQPANEARFANLAGSYCRARCQAAEYQARYFPFLQLVSVVAKAIALAAGAHRVAQGSLSAGLLIAFLLYLDQFFTPIQQLSTGYPSTGLLAMDDVSLTIPAGQVVALVGTTGAGKSTLVKLVARFYDATSGTIRIDGTPLRDLELAPYRHQLGFVPQEPFLFSGTIRSTIAYGRPSASDLEVEAAARAVGAHQFVAGLPQGYLTPVSAEDGSHEQLIALGGHYAGLWAAAADAQPPPLVR